MRQQSLINKAYNKIVINEGDNTEVINADFCGFKGEFHRQKVKLEPISDA